MTTGSHLHAELHDGDGPPALLVHGLLGSRSYWLDNLDALRAVCRPVVVELWGHGRSPAPADPDSYRPAAYVAEFERLREGLGVDHWFVIGQSLGGGLALTYAHAHPEAVAALVVTNSLSAFAPVEGWAQLAARTADPQAERIRREGIEVLRDAPLNPGRSSRLSPGLRAAMAAEFGEHDAEAIAATMTVTTASIPLGDGLRAITAPTLLTVGTREQRFVEMLDRTRAIAGLELVELDVGHPVNALDPTGWNAAVTAFLARHR